MVARLGPKPVLKVLQGYCPSCDKSTALAILFHGGMPTSGAYQIRSQCVSCGAVWDLPPLGLAGGAKAFEKPRRGKDQRKPKI